MKSETKKQSGVVVEIVKALIISVIISLVLILISALVIKLANVPTKAIPIINQVIKGLSILTGVMIAFKRANNGWVRGIVLGILYIAVSFVIFSLLDGTFVFGLNILNDLALGSVTGMVSGIIAANVKKQR